VEREIKIFQIACFQNQNFGKLVLQRGCVKVKDCISTEKFASATLIEIPCGEK